MRRFLKKFLFAFAVLWTFSVAQAQTANDAARFLAGLDLGENLASWSETPQYQQHKAALDEYFKEYNKRVRIPASDFSQREISDLGRDVVFYPFGGPDILNPCTFLPNARIYIMLGLEQIGDIPNLSLDEPADAYRGLRALLGALEQIFGYNFFRVLSMAEEVGAHRYSGVAALMMMFLARMGYEIVTYRRIELNPAGEIRLPSSDNPRGLEIHFRQPGGQMKTLYYFRGDVSDAALSKRGGLVAFIVKHAPLTTFLKAASYLMYEPSFDDMRSIVLTQSAAVVGEISGVPYHYFARDPAWNVKLYGRYSHPIESFKKYCQPDLAADISALDRPILPFPFGYQYKEGLSHMIIARHKGGALGGEPSFDATPNKGERTRCQGNRVKIELIP